MPSYADLKRYRANPDPAYPNKHKWISERLLTLRYDLDMTIVKDRRPNSLIVGTWNIRAFDGGLPRLDESLHYIAEIIAAFDICALQELKPTLGPIRRLKELLGPSWDYFLTDVCQHEGGNAERMAFFYNTDKVFFRNIIGEIVIASDALPSGRQIARSPFFAAFQAGWFRFTLCSSHIIYGDDHALRAAEITAITDALAKRARVEDQVFMFLGDMNIESDDGPIMAALKNSELELASVPESNLGGDKPYDQIAYTVKGKSTRKTRLLRSGAFDWRNAVFGPAVERDPNAPDDPAYVARKTDAENLVHYEPIVAAHRKWHGKDSYVDFSRSYKRWMTDEMSDHLPVWVELETDYSNEYLAKFVRD
ncbi:MAG: endonuclease/exonuclease/phosphatase family protein [Rhodobacteraceae bacterium]|nr:endonuclease/exonuclease/phosphatase family protein [Paracoccaceae bacterium]